ncbi:MAG TPA: DUF6518 family protein [Solirubrobacteraceae bacterium]
MQQLRLIAVVVVAAVGLGIGGRVLVHASGELPHGASFEALGRTVVALGAPWLVVAWGVGAIAGDRLRGALAGGIVLALGTAAWYWLSIATGGRAVVLYAVPLTVLWGAVGLAAGAAFGFAGALWRSGDARLRAFGLAPAAGALAGEAVLLSSQWGGRAAAVVLALEAAAAVALLVAGRRHAPLLLTVACFCVATAATAQAEDGVRDTLRAAGWAGR